MKKTRHTDSQIISILKQNETGISVAELCREHGMSQASFYKWCSKYGGMDMSLMKRMKELEDENRRLKRMYAEEKLKAEIAREAIEKKVVRPSRRKEMAQRASEEYNVSIRMVCAIFTVSPTCYRYQPKLSSENAEIADWLFTFNHHQ